MRSRLSSASDCWPAPEPPPNLPDLHLVDASSPALVNKWFSDRLYVECLADVALVAFAFCPPAAAFVIQCDNGSESVRAFSYVPVDSGSWHKGMPNARTCLLHQKLQLLNCCIKKALEGNGSLAGNSSEDEFFDCSEGENEDQLPWDRPVGRLSRFGDAVMKNGAPLYVPRTQDPAPKTEDQLEEDAELMVRLGDDAKASELRARMMSASLLSDMEAFKAANPGAELCDFVRWYSPRDWKPEDGGSLGDRMLLPGNPWVEAWEVARPVPASRQRRLFDETREAEQVLHFLRSRTVSATAELLLPAILRAGALKAHEEGGTCTSSNVGGVDTRRTFEIAARELVETEREVCRTLCVRTVLGPSPEGKPLDVAGRTRILNIAGGVLPAPARREFTLRVRDAIAPQVMRAALSGDMTIVGAFTERIVCL
ncbi:unnamed protein product [Arctia plantaginis]|uniref:Rab3 GTPase-activating protein catalytic subunit n=1 Tax=Arctia plantaginis TaxID=874455 RepID=A0A8S0ZFU3_ARCPL|nr:unnamed protein product [Arctia plantaginis]